MCVCLWTKPKWKQAALSRPKQNVYSSDVAIWQQLLHNVRQAKYELFQNRMSVAEALPCLSFRPQYSTDEPNPGWWAPCVVCVMCCHCLGNQTDIMGATLALWSDRSPVIEWLTSDGNVLFRTYHVVQTVFTWFHVPQKVWDGLLSSPCYLFWYC